MRRRCGEHEVHGTQAQDGEYVGVVDDEGITRDGKDCRDRIDGEHDIGGFHHRQRQKERCRVERRVSGRGMREAQEEMVAVHLVCYPQVSAGEGQNSVVLKRELRIASGDSSRCR